MMARTFQFRVFDHHEASVVGPTVWMVWMTFLSAGFWDNGKGQNSFVMANICLIYLCYFFLLEQLYYEF